MEIFMSDASRLKTLPFLLKKLFERYGLELKLAASREMAARMLGFQNWNTAIRRAVNSEKASSTNAFDEAARMSRLKQYTDVLVAAEIEKDQASLMGFEVAKLFENDFQRGELVETIYDDKWRATGLGDAASIMLLEGDSAIWYRSTNGADNFMKDYKYKADVVSANNQSGSVSVVFAFKHSKRYEVFGHVSYRQTISDAGEHLIEVLSEHSDRYVEHPHGEWSCKVMAHFIKTDLQESGYWLDRPIPAAGVPITISPSLDKWKRPMVALILVEKLYSMIQEEDEFGGPFGEDDESLMDRDHTRFSDVYLEGERNSTSRIPAIGIRNCSIKLMDAVRAAWTHMEFITARQRYIKVDPINRTVEPMEDMGGVLVGPVDRYRDPGTDYPGDHFAKDMREELTQELKEELFEFGERPFFLICGFARTAMVFEDDMLKASWGDGDGVVKRLVSAKEHRSTKHFNDMMLWKELLLGRFDQAMRYRMGCYKDSEVDTPPFSGGIKADWENDGIEEFFDDEEFDNYEIDTRVARSFQLGIGQAKNLLRQPGSLIVRPTDLDYENSARSALMKQYDKEDKYFVIDLYRTTDELEAAAQLGTATGLGEWSGFWQWMRYERETEVIPTLATVRFSGSAEPQAVVSYSRKLRLSSEMDLSYSIEIDGIFVPEKFRKIGLGLAAAHLIGLDAVADLEVIARQIDAVKAETGIDVAPDINISADADTQGEKNTYYRVANLLEGGVRAFFQLDKVRGPFQGGRYVVPDIG
jgi:hypothetical protein